MYAFLHKYKGYLRLKRFIPFGIVGPLTATELSKIAYACAIGSKSVALIISGIIGYSRPGFFFFHISYYYAPDKLKPLCQAGKHSLAASFLLISYLVDKLTECAKRKFFGEKFH